MSPGRVSGVRALIADDEQLARANLRALVTDRAGWSCLAESATGPGTLAAIQAHAPDVVFLDVRMPQLDGVHVARRIAEQEPRPLIIFATAFDQHAIAAFELDAVDYLLKPFDRKRFSAAAGRVERRLASKPDVASRTSAGVGSRIAVKSLGRIRFVNAAEIVWIASAGNYVQLYLADRCLLHRATLASMERELGSDRFVRVGRGAIVNVSQLVEISGTASGRYQLALRDGTTVDISHRYRARVFDRLGVR